MTYAEWIRAHVPSDPTGRCAEITGQMAATFPELTRVRGHYRWTQDEAPWPHWWCVAPDGAIIDPTATQWPDGGLGEYLPHDESQPEPTGKCPNCGGYCYEERYLCSPRCEREYLDYLRTGRL